MFGYENRGWRPWTFNGLDVLVPEEFRTTVEPEKGGTLIYPKGDMSAPPSGHMPKDGTSSNSIIRQKPLDIEHLDPADNTEQYQPLTEAELDGSKPTRARSRPATTPSSPRSVNTALGDIAWVPGPDLAEPKGVRDVAEWYMLTASHPESCTRSSSGRSKWRRKSRADRARVGTPIDVIFLCGTDFGTQTSSFCSDDTFDNLWKPHYAALCGWIHKHTNWKVFKHSCGASERFFELMIEAGVDIINPVQCSAKGMDPRMLKEKYKGRLVFWGGGVDTQRTLPFGTPDEVRAEVLERCEIFSDGGGFVFNAIHNVQAGTPVQNMVAMIDAVKEFNGVR